MVLIVVAIAVCFFGYRVIVTTGEVPGKLSSVSAAATNLNYGGRSFNEVSKVSFDKMKYGFMDGQMIREMDYLDSFYERERMEEIRAVNDLTAMSERTADRIAYAELKAKRDEEAEKARQAAKAAHRQFHVIIPHGSQRGNVFRAGKRRNRQHIDTASDQHDLTS